MAIQARTTKVRGTGKLFRQGKEISNVVYTIAHEPGNSRRIISGLFKVIKGQTDLLGSSRLTLSLQDGTQVVFGVSVGNVRSFEFIMDMNNQGNLA